MSDRSRKTNEGCAIPCNLCGSRNIDVLSLKDRTGEHLRTVICRECGLVWSDPRPDEASVRRYYKDDYRVQYKGAYVPKLKHVFRACNVALGRYEVIKGVLRPGDRVLDVGSGGGEFLYVLKKLGYAVEGIEPFEGYANYSIKEYGLKVHVGFLQEARLPEASFDVVTMFHALEHTEDPLGVVKRLKAWVKPSGHLVLEVPNVEAVCQAPGNRFHFAHFYNFNARTLETLGAVAGLEPVLTRISEDGANITMVFRAAGKARKAGPAIPGNYEHIKGVLLSHTPLKHFASAYPYARLAGKIARYMRERKVTSTAVSGRAIIDESLSKLE